jgi:hypothetical protein
MTFDEIYEKIGETVNKWMMIIKNKSWNKMVLKENFNVI